MLATVYFTAVLAFVVALGVYMIGAFLFQLYDSRGRVMAEGLLFLLLAAPLLALGWCVALIMWKNSDPEDVVGSIRFGAGLFLFAGLVIVGARDEAHATAKWLWARLATFYWEWKQRHGIGIWPAFLEKLSERARNRGWTISAGEAEVFGIEAAAFPMLASVLEAFNACKHTTFSPYWHMENAVMLSRVRRARASVLELGETADVFAEFACDCGVRNADAHRIWLLEQLRGAQSGYACLSPNEERTSESSPPLLLPAVLPT